MRRVIASMTAAAALILVSVFGLQTAASAASVPVIADPRISAMLEAVPGGVLVDAQHAVWPDLDMEMTVVSAAASKGKTTLSAASAARAAVGACATGKVCAFSLSATGGAKLSWGSCDASFPVGTFTVRSIADARSSGYVQAKYGTTVRATAYAGQWKNVYGSVSRIACVS